MSSCRYPMMGRLFVLYVFVKAKIEIPRSPIHPTRPPSPFLICMNMHRYPAASLSRKSTASRLLVARPSSASAEFPLYQAFCALWLLLQSWGVFVCSHVLGSGTRSVDFLTLPMLLRTYTIVFQATKAFSTKFDISPCRMSVSVVKYTRRNELCHFRRRYQQRGHTMIIKCKMCGWDIAFEPPRDKG